MQEFQSLNVAELEIVVGGKRKGQKSLWWKIEEFSKGFMYGLSH